MSAIGKLPADDLSHSDVATPLSPRENQVLRMASLGLTNRQIAERLDVTPHAVKFHLSSIYRKLRVANRTEAVARTLRPTPEQQARVGAEQQ